MPTAKPDQARALAEKYEPTLVFSGGERVFPALVESYLSHVSLAAWLPAVGEQPVRDIGVWAESTIGPNHRGTAVMDGPAPGTRRGGPDTAGAPLRRDGFGTDAIGHPAYRGSLASPELFLTFGGWSDTRCTSGDPGYLRAAFSELSAAMDPSAPWEEFESLSNRPLMWVEQPTTPTLYAEVTWCGDYPRIDESADHMGGLMRDFAGGPDTESLGRVLALTYYVFFPLMDGPDAGSPPSGAGLAGRMREGQWEAATVYFAGTPSGTDDPSDFDYLEPPLAVALSRDANLDSGLAACRAWQQVTRDGTHPRLYVSRGRHHLLFAPPEDQTGNYDGPGGGASTDTRLDTSDPGQDDFPGSEALLIAALVLGSPLVLLLWLITVLLGLHNDAHNGADGPPPDLSAPMGDGAGSIAAPAGVAAPGEVLPDGRRIDDPATTLLRFVNGLERDPRRTAWPDDDDPGAPPPRFEHPYWWDFPGRWGVDIRPESTTWSSGTRRVDRFGRSLAYWNTVSLARAWAQGLVPRPQ
ncbi:hypothetical protein [Microbispora hainanensis]|uniref:hypothetical protein n=1 Tax=Microbispora hainanensis TaxID=568844 RepID=UPI003244A1B1